MLDTAAYPVARQLALAKGAEALSGPHGAGFIHASFLAPEGSNNLLAFFASPGARVATLSPPYTYPLGDVGAILAALGVDFEVVVGPDEPTEEDFCAFWNDYRIDPVAFAWWLRDWA